MINQVEVVDRPDVFIKPESVLRGRLMVERLLADLGVIAIEQERIFERLYPVGTFQQGRAIIGQSPDRSLLALGHDLDVRASEASGKLTSSRELYLWRENPDLTRMNQGGQNG